MSKSEIEKQDEINLMVFLFLFQKISGNFFQFY